MVDLCGALHAGHSSPGHSLPQVPDVWLHLLQHSSAVCRQLVHAASGPSGPPPPPAAGGSGNDSGQRKEPNNASQEYEIYYDTSMGSAGYM
eukprot:scaffold70041_cov18-Prasinocladus_malaysianus.AAC.1